MPTQRSRRWFLEAFTVAAAATALDALPSSNGPQAAEPAPEGDRPLPVIRDLFPRHVDLVIRRSKQQHEQLKKSLLAKEARPLTAGACQMANHCGGEAGKKG